IGLPVQNRLPPANPGNYGYYPSIRSSPNRPLNPAGYGPYASAGYPYYQQSIMYANQAALSLQEQQKKYWAKFMLNTGSTLAGLSLAAYFGMKILTKAIVSEMGVQIKNNLLPRASKETLLKHKRQELLRSAETPKWLKDLIGKDPKTLTTWQKAKLEKV